MRTKKSGVSGDATYGFQSDTNTGLHSAAADHVSLLSGGVAVWEAGTDAAGGVWRNQKTVRVALAASDAAGGVFAWANPTGGSIIVTSVIVNVTTQSAGACTVDVGIGATAGTSNDTFIDGVSVAATGAKDNIKDAGTNGVSAQQVTSSQFVTASMATGATSGLAGFAYITYMPV
jgi:hypothetical protein